MSESELKRIVQHQSKRCPVRILITGSQGYIGSNLRKYLQDEEYDVYGLSSRNVQEEKTYRADIIDSQKIFDILRVLKPAIIIHTAALSSLNECEKNTELAMRINVEGTRSIINAVRKINPDIKLIFMSTDYVFDGKRGNYREDDEVDPQTSYGKTKAISENDIKNNLENYTICRTANVFGRGGNFFNFVLDALERNRTIGVYKDAFFTPTYIGYLMSSIKELIEMDYRGIIHIAGSERMSRYDFALKMAEAFGKDKTLIKPIKRGSGELIAKDSSLNCEYSRKILKNLCPSVEESLHYCFGNFKPPYFYFIDERGKFIGILQGGKWKEVNYIESSKGSIRGNHYHKETKECFFIIEGRIRVSLLDLVSNLRRVFIVKKGDILLVNPNTLHTFEVLEDSKWINMLSKTMNHGSKDFHRMPQ